MAAKLYALLFAAVFSCNLFAQTGKESKPVFPAGTWFIENRGQVASVEGDRADNVLYTLHQPSLEIYVTKTGLTYVFMKPEKEKEEEKEHEFDNGEKDSGRVYMYERFDIDLTGAHIEKENIVASEPTSHAYNFYIGGTRCYETGVHGYHRLLVKNIYNGIDWELLTSDDGLSLKYNFIVNPGADPSLINLLYRGINPLVFKDDRTLQISTAIGSISDQIPLAYCGDKKNVVDVRYQLFDNGAGIKREHETHFGFRIGNYDATKTLVIDPAQLAWGTYFGGNMQMMGTAIFIDHDGSPVFISNGDTPGFPVLDPGNNAYYQDTVVGTYDAIIAKFDSSGVLLWCTYFGGDAYDAISAVRAMPNNDLVMCGFTYSTDIPTANPGGGAFFQPAASGYQEGMMLRFSPSGVLLWSTYIGSSLSGDELSDMDVDALGNIYVVGNTQSNCTLPAFGPAGSYVQGTVGNFEAMVMRFTSNGVLNWFTYFAGSTSDYLSQVRVTPTQHIVVYGSTTSNDLPVISPPQQNGYYQPNLSSAFMVDLFLARFTPTLALDWCTYMGTTTNDNAGDLDIDHYGGIIVTAYTGSTSFPIVNPGGGAYYFTSGASHVLAYFNDSLEYEWGTYLEIDGNNTESASISVGPCSEIYVAGYYSYPSSNMTLDPGGGAYYFGSMAGYADLLIAEFNHQHQLTWGTFYGGSGMDDGMITAVDAFGNLYATGDAGGLSYTPTTAVTFQANCLLNPGGGAWFQNTPGMYIDYPYMLKMRSVGSAAPPITSVVTSTDPDCPAYNNGSIIISPSGGLPGYSINWIPGNMTDTMLSNLTPGIYSYTITDSLGCVLSGAVTLVQGQPYDLTVMASTDTICAGETTTLNAAGAPSVTWNPAVGIGNTITVSPTSTTTYVASHTDSAGCVSQDSITIYVTICDGISGQESMHFSAEPNPVTTELNLLLPGNETWTIEVFDSNGKLIANEEAQGTQAKLSCSSWSEGIYIVRLSNNKVAKEFKVVKVSGN